MVVCAAVVMVSSGIAALVSGSILIDPSGLVSASANARTMNASLSSSPSRRSSAWLP